MYDLIIVGGGPAGCAAAVYAARKELKTLFLTKDFEGQSAVSADIHNWIGIPSISGADLSKALEAHVRSYEGQSLEIRTGEWAQKVAPEPAGFSVTTDKGAYEGKTILLTSGGRRRTLEVPGAKEYDQKGLTYCATCDGPLFAGRDVAVIGGGNAGFETAAQLLAYCQSVSLFHKNAEFKADPIIIHKLLSNPKFKAIPNAEPLTVLGEAFVTGLEYKDLSTGETHKLAVSGIFVEIGFLPNTELVQGVVALSPTNSIVVDPATQRASLPGIWAAGDCTNAKYHQNNIAAGDAVKAVEDIYIYLHTGA